MKNYLLRSYLIAILSIGLVNCNPQSQKTSQAPAPEGSRKIASVEATAPSLKTYPSSMLKFVKGETQRIKLSRTLKQYSHVLPKSVYDRMIKISHSVDDKGFSIERNGNVMILNNGNQLKVNIKGPANNLLLSWEGKTLDLSDESVFLNLLDELETQIRKSKSAGTKAPHFHTLPFLFLTPQEAQAIGTGWWFAIGGLALVSFAIIYAANKLGKSIKKTEHTVTVTHEIEVGDDVTSSINNLADSISEIDTSGTVDIDVTVPDTSVF